MSACKSFPLQEATKKDQSTRPSYSTNFVAAKSDTSFNMTGGNDNSNQKDDNSSNNSVFADIASNRKATMQVKFFVIRFISLR